MSTRSSGLNLTAAFGSFSRRIFVGIGLFALTLSPVSAGAVTNPDCLAEKMLHLFAKDADQERITQYRNHLTLPIPVGKSLAELSIEAGHILEEYARHNPDFPRAEFLDYMTQHPVDGDEFAQLVREKSTIGDLIDRRFAAYRRSLPGTQMLEEGSQVATRVAEIASKCRGNVPCQRLALGEWIKRYFPCTFGTKGMVQDMIESLIITNASYAVGVKLVGKPWSEYPIDLTLTNLFWMLPMQEVGCRNALKKAQMAAHPPHLTLGQKSKNFYLGETAANGIRPGFFRTSGKNWQGYMRYSAPWAGTYVLIHAAAEKIRGRENNLDLLANDPLKALTHMGADVVTIMIWDSVFAVPRSILITDYAHKVALPGLLKHNVTLVPVRTASRVTWGAISSELFKRYERGAKDIPDAVLTYVRGMAQKEKDGTLDDPSVPPSVPPESLPPRAPAQVRKDARRDPSAENATEQSLSDPRRNPALPL